MCMRGHLWFNLVWYGQTLIEQIMLLVGDPSVEEDIYNIFFGRGGDDSIVELKAYKNTI